MVMLATSQAIGNFLMYRRFMFCLCPVRSNGRLAKGYEVIVRLIVRSPSLYLFYGLRDTVRLPTEGANVLNQPKRVDVCTIR